MRISRNIVIWSIFAIILSTGRSVFSQTIVYQQFFHNRFDQLPFPINGWQAYHGENLRPVHVNHGGVIPIPSCDYGQLGYVEYTGNQAPVIFWTDDLGTNSLLVEQLGEISFFQQNDTLETKARLFLSFRDGDQLRLIASKSRRGSTNASVWSESIYPISTNSADWLVVQAFAPAKGRTPGVWRIDERAPDFDLKGMLIGFGFIYPDVDGVIRFDHVLVKEKEPVKTIFPFPVIYLKIGLAVLGLVVVIYIITHLTIVFSSLSKSAHDANEILHGHATTSHHTYGQTSSKNSDKNKQA